ncbi:MAG: NAD(+) synthase [Kiritimatiellia bacterium]
MNGFHRVAAAVPTLKVGDPECNVEGMLKLYAQACEAGAAIVAFPELAVTGYSCGDLFEQRALLDAAEAALARFIAATAERRTIAIVGAPLRVGARLFNAAAVIGGGRLLGLPMKEHLPNHRGFHEGRQFRSVREFTDATAVLAGQEAPAGAGLVFDCEDGLRFGVEIGEDLRAVVPPSSHLAIGGAQVVFNLAADAELVAKAESRRAFVANHSARLSGTYVLAGAGVHESTADAVFGGHAMVAFNGRLVAETPRFARTSSIIFADVKPTWTDGLRAYWTNFNDAEPLAPIERVPLPAAPPSPDLRFARLDPRPFVPADSEARFARCHEVFSIQAAGLAKRIEHTGAKRLVVGLSGGLDSTLALLVCVKACDLLGLPPSFICAVSMPGFGTSDRTRNNAGSLAAKLKVEFRLIPIGPAVRRHFKDIGHDPECRDVVYENAQARERTQILMDLANAEEGLLVGTGDLSEIALGWCTFNADHMSMYNVNCSVPKTLVRSLLDWQAAVSDPKLTRVLRDIADTPVSPELLPGAQETERLIGRYELHDFFLYHFMKFGETPEGLALLAEQAFGDEASPEEIRSTLKVFLRRFLSQQFKRNAMPDGPKVGTIGLSPRGDWRSPSDASMAVWKE